MTKRKDDAAEVIPVPALTASPPAEPIATLAGPSAEPAPAEEPKRRRRRHKPEVAPVTPEGAATPEDLERCKVAISTTFEIGSAVLAKKRGAHWQLDAEESAKLGDVWTVALAPYLPQIGAAVPFAAALAVTAAMAIPRLQQDAALAEGAPTGPVAVP